MLQAGGGSCVTILDRIILERSHEKVKFEPGPETDDVINWEVPAEELSRVRAAGVKALCMESAGNGVSLK